MTNSMQVSQWWTKKLIFATFAVFFVIVPLSYRHAIPIERYREYVTGDTVVEVKPNNERPQTQYFKLEPEWNWDVPDYASSLHGFKREPKPENIIVLTASDGGGHNNAIPNLLERVLENREEYCGRHGYTNLWLNTSRYDIGDSHRVWAKIPALAEAFYLYPKAEWVWLMDADMIIMSPSVPLIANILSPSAIEKGIMHNTMLLNGKGPQTNIYTPTHYRVEDVDILITQDHQFVNAGSIFFRRSAFTRIFLEMMTDRTMLMGKEHALAEQDAIKHLMVEHELVRKHVGVFPQRRFNAYANGGPHMMWDDGDLAVHFAGCWVHHDCKEWFEEYWVKRGRYGTGK
ncbi:glycosyltransferase family 34 protein [Bipolaris maydis ATCC 48331]|uniref:Glycosyltransferase family 34 protein n=1 Tax=Cochliobolus heterostrophus (strain C4 / ATCC 48331 / race T) TaxID=665024 RepID=N4XU63_COCH4|nr:glycosyltransferase family 34 protein [Bipolaris maydis ATCC 48331]KAH7563260.1 glycosyltransferase family 34 protein [Bipolaris maydis]ENI09901.1 glycosyltransferase family 34 protein [Bipolaris maydis ATCC 48331]KAJ5025421.1 glycosyltransferase [Bipolaris maydis]KAJ5064021.1 galactosyl transferase GMA12/MNN10 family-domain-containing protein [Bipolaris maydis]KAJ6269636.1 glycosyltransferase [Bipolaris maydis]